MHSLTILALAPDTLSGGALWAIIEPRYVRSEVVANSVHALPVLALTPDALSGGALWAIIEPRYAPLSYFDVRADFLGA